MRLLLTLALLLACTAARAEWEVLTETGTAVYYVDRETVRTDGALKRIWGLQDMKAPDAGGVFSRRVLDEYDCKAEKFRMLSVSHHSGRMAQGATLANYRDAGPWDHIAPNTVAAKVLKLICR